MAVPGASILIFLAASKPFRTGMVIKHHDIGFYHLHLFNGFGAVFGFGANLEASALLQH
jgi:hypothetical protein